MMNGRALMIVAVPVFAVEGILERNLVGGDGRGVDALGVLAELDPAVGVAAAAVLAKGWSRCTVGAAVTAAATDAEAVAANFPDRGGIIHRQLRRRQ